MCSACGNIMNIQNNGNIGTMVCFVCGNAEQMNLTDHIISTIYNEENNNSSDIAIEINEKIAGGICEDPTYNRIRLKCVDSKCTNDVVVTLVSSLMTQIFICCKCKQYWQAK